ncbi:MAG: hypothetical protein ACXV7J_15580 [Methylomonas sp.]
MFSTFQTVKSASSSAGLTLQDLLDEHGESYLSDYLALSLTNVGEGILISLTTTGDNPVTYSAVIGSAEAVDLASLVFVVRQGA